MLRLASKYPKQRLVGPKFMLLWILIFYCQLTHAATIDSSSLLAKGDSPDRVRALHWLEANYSSGLLLLPEWELLPVEARQLGQLEFTARRGDIALTVAEINLLDSKEKTVDNLELILADCPAGNLACAPANAFPLPAAAWLFGSGILGLLGVQRRVWEPEFV